MRLYIFLISFVLSSVVLAVDNEEYRITDFTCDQSGYVSYLNNWSENEKSSSRDTTSDEFNERLGYFVDNCLKIHEWNRKDKYKLEFTYYADWSESEFEKLGSTTQRYTGMKPDIYETEVFFNNTNHSSMHPITDPCDDIHKEVEDTSRQTNNNSQ